MKGALRLLLLLPVVLSVFGFSFTAYADYCVGVFSQGYHVTTLMHYANNLSSGTADSYVANWNNDHYKAMSNSGSYGNPTVIGQARFVRFRKINGSSTGAYFDARNSSNWCGSGYPNNQTILTEVQRVLWYDGYYSGAQDGIWGPQTSNAVYYFQLDNGLTTDRVVGNSTYTKLVMPVWSN